MRSFLLGLILLLLTVSACSPRPLTVREAWSRPCVAGSVCVVYLTIDNSGGKADAVLSATTDVAADAELHETITQSSGTVTMKQRDNVPVPAGRVIEFKPGGLHIMLIDVQHDLTPGETFSLTLHFEKAGEMRVLVMVREP